ncbi:MAG: hypothetical protein AAF824_07255 [Bacteroidota bacterium]
MDSFSLSSYWMIGLVVLISLGFLAIILYRNRLFRLKQGVHEQLASDLGLKITYTEQQDFTIFGENRTYPVHITPHHAALAGKKKVRWSVKTSVPMVNPNLMAIRISRNDVEPSPFLDQVPVYKPQTLAHSIAPWLEVLTNDLMFSHRILSDDIKMDLVVAFKQVPEAILFVMDNELACIIPGLLYENYPPEVYKAFLNLLLNIKDELN